MKNIIIIAVFCISVFSCFCIILVSLLIRVMFSDWLIVLQKKLNDSSIMGNILKYFQIIPPKHVNIPLFELRCPQTLLETRV